MKVRASVKKMCKDCKIIKRHGVIRVICKELFTDDANNAMTLNDFTIFAHFFN